MLKALELVGFKSFADKTRFEFPSGITVVVGPNGSGKSNVVDGIKWVLGEQSVKSLRGKEMADVIFNGSGARRGQNSAEVTLTFDNASGVLPVDSREVHITRRVYRSGEGEYLINRQPSRLRDIRDLLAGTGLGTQAYSVIEQGKVDVLLQSSAKDRRIIFEEAAGISRFKARKIEALRRLERVQQNLLRLSDIVDEVESRLRSVKLQAGKARRYREYTARLQDLRTQVAQADWRKLTDRLTALETELATLTDQRDSGAAEAERLEAELLEAEHYVGEINEAVRASEAEAAANRERIAAAESTIEHERVRAADLEQEIDRHRRQLAAMNARAGGLKQQVRETAATVEAAESEQREIARRVGEGERVLTDLIDRLDHLRSESHQRRTAHTEQMRTAASLGSQTSGLESQAAAAATARDRSTERLAEVDEQMRLQAVELEALARERETLARSADDWAQQLGDARARLADRRQQRERRQADLLQLQQRRTALAERVSVLEELEKRFEGFSPGVREVMTLARKGDGSPLRHVRGLVADLLRVSVEAAPLVEVALGEAAQHVVIGPAGRDLLDWLQSQPYQFGGRVGFVWLTPDEKPQARVELDGRPGILGRADRFIETEPEYEPLARRLLGRTWIVENLAAALASFRREPAAGYGYVTLAGELLSADGTLVVGPRHTSSGLISRRSELRALREQLAELEGRVQQAETAVLRLDQQIVKDQEQAEALAAEHARAADALAQHQHKITAAEERQSQLARQRPALEAELTAAAAQCETAVHSLAEIRRRQADSEVSLADMEGQLASLAQQIERLEAERQARGREATDAKVELAKSEERLRNLRSRMRQFEESQAERERAIVESRDEMLQCIRRGEESRWSILRAESEIAELYLRKETFHARTVELIDKREALQAERSSLASQAQKTRQRVRGLDEKSHAKELAANEIRLERNTLVERLREDYGIELAQLDAAPSDEEQRQREEVQREIDELRQRIAQLGNVNLEALEELDQLDQRHATLAAQYRDLAEAKAALERILDKINIDSRRLFTETLETVRGHFQKLFRDLFGGGQADIVPEQGADILEGGIEIVARPPGKEPRSISLLSGGEKTLTCVALLLAIFRSRPSPFCVLDEVDAALDEANIDRFTKVIQDFLAWTQFIIITHSKKTMTCASTIYGVTMQESGVSKQVSVRFEDVSETGEIRLTNSRTDEPPAAASGGTQAA
jgi:chromosome segregation protein